MMKSFQKGGLVVQWTWSSNLRYAKTDDERKQMVRRTWRDNGAAHCPRMGPESDDGVERGR